MKSMYISSWPGLTLNDLLPSRTGKATYPFTAANKSSFCVARSGIYHLFRALQLAPGDRVLVPDYHSGNEFAAIRAAGATIEFYPIHRNLEPDLEALSRLASQGARVIYLIHYLGWPQPVKEIQAICRRHGSILVEDCALSLFGETDGKSLGVFGDYSVFCLYKTLPVPNGGVLVQNDKALPALTRLELERCPRLSALGRSAELALETVRSRWNRIGKTLFDIKRGAGRRMRAANVRQVPVGDIGWDVANVNIAMSGLSDTIARGSNYERIRRRRRENFLRLQQNLAGRVSLLRNDMGPGVCPLFFPILVRDKHAAAEALRHRGIEAVEFWNDPQRDRKIGADARYLRSHVLELPIHQGVSEQQVDYIAEQVRQLKLEPVS
jgi:dTDP-4-amino-4,6-dideoxygalactose transaminase